MKCSRKRKCTVLVIIFVWHSILRRNLIINSTVISIKQTCFLREEFNFVWQADRKKYSNLNLGSYYIRRRFLNELCFTFFSSTVFCYSSLTLSILVKLPLSIFSLWNDSRTCCLYWLDRCLPQRVYQLLDCTACTSMVCILDIRSSALMCVGDKLINRSGGGKAMQ